MSNLKSLKIIFWEHLFKRSMINLLKYLGGGGTKNNPKRNKGLSFILKQHLFETRTQRQRFWLVFPRLIGTVICAAAAAAAANHALRVLRNGADEFLAYGQFLPLVCFTFWSSTIWQTGFSSLQKGRSTSLVSLL